MPGFPWIVLKTTGWCSINNYLFHCIFSLCIIVESNYLTQGDGQKHRINRLSKNPHHSISCEL